MQLPQSPPAVDFSCSTQELVCVEIFAGCAQLSSSLRSSGFSVLPIDHKNGKMSKAKLTLLDLTKQHDFDVLLSILTTANIAYCHCAPVCGTGSRAREIPLPKGMEHVRAEPLRSQEFPLGLPHLVGKDLARVTAANILYFVTLIACFLASLRNFAFSAENPSTAYFWLAAQCLAERFPVLADAWFAMEAVHFQSCAHGGQRDKWTCWYGTPGLFVPLRALCTHTHDKSAWRPYLTSQGNVIFPTSSEAAYPEALCHKVAQLVLQFSCARGAQAPNDAFLPQGMTHEQRTGRKHGISLLPPLVAEYKMVTDQLPPDSAEFRQISSLPAGRKTGCDVALGIRGTEIQISGDYKVGDALYGIYRAPDEFIQAALQAKHPIDYASSIPEVLIKNVAKVLSEGPKLVIARRKLAVMKIKRRALQLQDEEAKLHESLNPELAGLLEGKNLLLWKELMEQTGFQDPQLFDELTQGFHVVGQATYSPAFPRGYVPMQQTPEELKRKAIWMRKADEAKCRSTGRPELDLLVWNQTLEECEKGWMRGPYSEDQVSGMVGSKDWLATRRFPLEQKDKVRLIDDALSSGLNSAYGTSNKLTLFDVDTLVSLILQISGALQNSESGLPLMSGEVVKLQLSQQWGGTFSLVGRTLDLQSAYKQLGPFMDDVWNRVIMVYNPTLGAPQYFVSSALMFGSTAAVYAFNRVSRSLSHILVHTLSLWMTVYYDDFPMVELEETCQSAEQGIAEVLDALGWKFAREGAKAPPFAKCFDVLGVNVDLTGVASGSVVLKNKPSRVEALCSAADKFILAERVEAGEAASIHGQLNFAHGQYLGAPLKPAMQFFSMVASQGWNDDMRPALAVACLFTRTILMTSLPKTISLKDICKPILVFTDGAWEPTSDHPAGAGIVVLDEVTNTRIVHEVYTPEALVQHWKQQGKAQLIAELELLPIIVFFQNYLDLCKHRRVLLFVDNNAIRDAVAKGTSRSLAILVLLSEMQRLWSESQCHCWVSRVPSKSNVSDFPSRQQPERAAEIIQGIVGASLRPSEALCQLICDSKCFVSYMGQLMNK